MAEFNRTRIVRRLLAVCDRHCLPAKFGVVIRESYIPHLPQDWNGILILAEAQKLSSGEREYVRFLKSLDRDGRFRRLGRRGKFGIRPWTDRSLPFALAAVFPKLPTDTYAVSNAVPWSIRTQDGANANPSRELVSESVEFWREALDVLQPETIICAGNVARKVIRRSWTAEPLALRLPSRRVLSLVVGMFDTDDLLHRYPEVADALDRFPELRDKTHWQNKVLYACHAVSVARTVRFASP